MKSAVDTTFKRLPKPKQPEGTPRRVGFEFEFAGTSAATCLEIIHQLFGGQIEKKHSQHAKITGSKLGDFTVELDALPVQNIVDKLENTAPNMKDDDFKRQLSQLIGDISRQFVPMEITTAPLVFEQFDQLERLREALRQNEALGTKTNITHAFGLHINPEIPSEDVHDSLRIFKAFLLLYPWMLRHMQVDMTRRIMVYIKPFSPAYVRMLLQNNAINSWEAFANHYLKDNATRNRALDLLPLLAHMVPSVRDRLDEHNRDLLKPRPAYHYRLPNCEINDANWSIAKEWNIWVKVEKLAFDAERLELYTKKYLAIEQENFIGAEQKWVEFLEAQDAL